MSRRPTRSKRTYTLFPYTTLFRSDEFDRATSRSFRRSIAELIKNLSDRSARVQLVVAGVAANFMELIEHIPSIRSNVLNLELPRMDDSEVDEMLQRSEEHTSELQSLMSISYAVFCLKQQKQQ